MPLASPPQQHHQMHLAKTHPSGAEEWLCPTCGRRTLMHWQPQDEKLDFHVIEAGDLYAIHVGSKGGFQIGSPNVITDDQEPVLSKELRDALEEVLGDIGFDDWPDAPNA